MIASVDKGIFATNFAGGQVDITSGNFVFSASNAYLIENGKLKHSIKGATISGVGFDALTKISMVGDDLSLDSGVGLVDSSILGVSNTFNTSNANMEEIDAELSNTQIDTEADELSEVQE
jgi:predicted Zn-dependent protease